MKKAYFVDYKTKQWDHCYIVAHAENEAQARKMVKDHVWMYSTPEMREGFRITRVTEYTADHVPDDWGYLPEGGEVHAQA